jgi:hypothetical protein
MFPGQLVLFVGGASGSLCASGSTPPNLTIDVAAALQTLRTEVKEFGAAFVPALAQLHAAVRKIEGSIITAMVEANEANIQRLTERTLDRIDYLLWGTCISKLVDELKLVESELSASINCNEDEKIVRKLREDLIRRRDEAGLDESVREAFSRIRACEHRWDVPISGTKDKLIECIDEQLPRTNFVQESLHAAALVVADKYFQVSKC